MKNTEKNKAQVFLDTNILIDNSLFRGTEALAIEHIMDSAMDNRCELHIAAHSLTNMYYILRANYSEAERKLLILNYCATCTVEKINKERIENAIDNDYAKDLEDALQIQCAIESKCDYFITRDKYLFKKCPIKTMLPHELIKELSL
jgi:predicted nucleic acid-binding protein